MRASALSCFLPSSQQLVALVLEPSHFLLEFGPIPVELQQPFVLGRRCGPRKTLTNTAQPVGHTHTQLVGRDDGGCSGQRPCRFRVLQRYRLWARPVAGWAAGWEQRNDDRARRSSRATCSASRCAASDRRAHARIPTESTPAPRDDASVHKTALRRAAHRDTRESAGPDRAPPHPFLGRIEQIGQRQCRRVATALFDHDMQRAITADGGDGRGGNRFQLRNQRSAIECSCSHTATSDSRSCPAVSASSPGN